VDVRTVPVPLEPELMSISPRAPPRPPRA
jgi:hypothetical protein